MQAKSAYPKVLTFAIRRALGMRPPRIIVQVWDKVNKRWKTGGVDL